MIKTVFSGFRLIIIKKYFVFPLYTRIIKSKKRKTMKTDIKQNQTEYIELCETARKKIRQDIRSYNKNKRNNREEWKSKSNEK